VTGEAEFVRYPFMPAAEKYLRDSGFSIGDITDPSAPKAREIMARAEERILAALARTPPGIRYRDRYVETFSFFLALIVVKAAASAYLERTFARSEGSRSKEAFKNEEPVAMCRIINELFDLHMETVDKLPWRADQEVQMRLTLRVPADRYLETMAKLQLLDNPRLALINNTLHRGYVYLSKYRLVDIVQDQFAVYILQRLRKMERPVKLPSPLQEMTDSIVARLPKPRPSRDLGQYDYIEKMLQTPIMDGRHRVLWLILPPYLVNVKKMSDQEAYDLIIKYLDKCGWHAAGAERLVRYNINRARRIGLLPPRLERLAETNPGLHKAIVEAVSKHEEAK